MSEEPKIAVRQKTFLKGTLYYDNRRGSVECTIRDISDTGARLTFEYPASIPDHVELYIPQKQQTLRAVVQRREHLELGIAFGVERSAEPRRAMDADFMRRFEAMEAELVSLKRLVTKLKAKILPNDMDAG